MKILHASLSTFLAEVKTAGQPVRVAALVQSTMTPTMTAPLYTSWIVVTAELGRGAWAEWRMLVGRQRAELTERSYPVPSRLTKLTEERLAEVRGWIEATGLAMAPGILAHDAESVDRVLE
jgi:hypothetical protein